MYGRAVYSRAVCGWLTVVSYGWLHVVELCMVRLCMAGCVYGYGWLRCVWLVVRGSVCCSGLNSHLKCSCGRWFCRSSRTAASILGPRHLLVAPVHLCYLPPTLSHTVPLRLTLTLRVLVCDCCVGLSANRVFNSCGAGGYLRCASATARKCYALISR